MNWFTGMALYLVIWWIILFAVLPFFSRARAEPDPLTGWRGTPERVRLGRIVLVNTLVAAVIWAGCYWVIVDSSLSFRSGWPGDGG
jgi:predicted secreted protein